MARPMPLDRPRRCGPAAWRACRSACGPAGFSRQPRDVHVAEIGEHQRARDRRRRHHQHVDGARPCARAPAAGARRSGAARRPRRARDRGTRRLLEQRMGADDDVDARRSASPVEIVARARGPSRARSGWRRRMPGRLGTAASSVAKCWRARISVGAISAACPPASTARGHGQQRNDRLAGADIALQQAQHALGRAMSAPISASACRCAASARRAGRRSAGPTRRPSPASGRPARAHALARTSASAIWPASSSS